MPCVWMITCGMTHISSRLFLLLRATDTRDDWGEKNHSERFNTSSTEKGGIDVALQGAF